MARMAVLIFCIGCVVLVLGTISAGYGTLISEFSFGNTLIIVGVTMAAGGLIVIALSAVVSQLQQIVMAMAPDEGLGATRSNGAPTSDRVRFPSKPESFRGEAHKAEPAKTVRAVSVRATGARAQSSEESFTPTLPNPELPPETASEEVDLEREGLPRREVPSFRRSLPAGAVATPEANLKGDEWRTVAVLKSGVVDGMRYTLYVDGSIEAELPQGILRFASINELRDHLKKNL
jgi:hypothetical protein